MNISDLSAAQLSQAANIKAQIEKLQAELASVLGTGTPALAETAPATAAAPAPVVAPVPVAVSTVPLKRVVSAETRAKMAAAQKRRRAGKQPATAVQKPGSESKMTPAAKALLSVKLKAYWAKRKAAKK